MAEPHPSPVVVVRPAPPAVLHRRLRRAYLLSRNRVVVLALEGVDIPTIDRVLDRIIAEQGTGFSGVLYRTAGSEAAPLPSRD